MDGFVTDWLLFVIFFWLIRPAELKIGERKFIAKIIIEKR